MRVHYSTHLIEHVLYDDKWIERVYNIEREREERGMRKRGGGRWGVSMCMQRKEKERAHASEGVRV